MIPAVVALHFEKVDPQLYQASLSLKPSLVLQPRTDYFAALCESIVGQQISTKAGDAIWGRFCTLFPDKKVTVEKAVTLQVEMLRGIGVSNSKARYILDLATKVANLEIDLEQLPGQTDEEIMKELTLVKGIGPWTVEMFLMFTLGREDIFSTRDLGLKRAIQKLYDMTYEPSMQELEEISLPWSPYRTYASMILWRTLS
ncbi:DNA-3-methyladenine glycosylase [soil metagenome]